jgi:hypothetical protein
MTPPLKRPRLLRRDHGKDGQATASLTILD